MAALFDHYVIVDWSAANQRKTGRDSIWICHRGPDGERCTNPETRYRAKAELSQILASVTARGERAIVGFDFPFGYPEGFAARLGLNGAAPWRAVWDEIARLLQDAEDNRNNRFTVGAALNERISGKAFPFWGCPAAQAGAFLAARHHRLHVDGESLRERRLIDCWMVGAQPCWKLAYTGSVGSQALTGIPVVSALRDDPRWAANARVWPFETGLCLPDDARIVFAECWPSWWRWRPTQLPAEVNDRAQVRHVAALAAAADRDGSLGAWFAGDPGLTEEQQRLVITEEAWTLGVTSSRHSAKSVFSKRRPLPRKRAGQSHLQALPLDGGGLGGGDRAGWRPGAAQLAISPPPQPSPIKGEGAHTSTAIALRKRGRVRVGVRTATKETDFSYLREPAAIYRRSFALIRAEADLTRFPQSMQPLALRLAHAAGDVAILDDLVWSRGAAAAGQRALAAGAAILVDAEMTAAGIIRPRLPRDNAVICTLRHAAVAGLAASLRTTRSAAAVELWRPHLKGAVVAIGNAPTALFHLLEMLAAGAEPPALVLGFPVGFVGAAEAKEALVRFGRRVAFVALNGRRGGSALAAAAVNALAGHSGDSRA